jgi:ppGpp synthetase/RelA/SpoT-type nucleotidyltranferase
MAVLLVAANCRIASIVTHAYTSPKQPHVSRMNHPTPQMAEDALTEKDSAAAAAAATTGAQPLPPWLSRHAVHTKESVERQVEGLEFALLDHGISPMDVRDVALTMESASKGDRAKLAGMVDFLTLILDLEGGEHVFVTRQVLLASVLHYGDCVTARETGVYEMVRDAIFRDAAVTTAPRLWPPAVSVKPPTAGGGQTAAIAEYVPTTAMVLPRDDDGVGEYDEDVMVIARGAARVKRAEIMAQTVLGPGRIPSKEEAIRIRGLLLSVMDDWRAMGIRTVACLFRLNGLIHDSNNGASQYMERTPEVVHAAREALCVYAPLAQRLGMQRLKNKIEDSAFQVLYKRQYSAVSGLYQHSGPAIKAISRHLEDQISEVLLRNQALMEQLEDIQITSRVKEPYSSWKKLLKVRLKGQQKLDRALVGSTTSSAIPSTAPALSLVDLKDMVALRIVLRAKKWSEDEPVETTRGRERLLCYFVQHLVRSEWPELDDGRMKDYIQHPKPNGYQSLHYTSSIASQSVRWPFEVQVRSDEMHKNAEYGVAAHWGYKDHQAAEALAPAPLQALPQGEESVMNEIFTSVEGGRPLEVISVAEQSYIDALVNAKQSLVRQTIFCFFAGAIDNKGQLLSLPIRSTVADAMEQLQQVTGTDVLGAKILINGRKAELNDLVANGDVLLVSL